MGNTYNPFRNGRCRNRWKDCIKFKVWKNLIGAFHLPEKVFIHNDFLDTLPEFELKSGLGEVIKYGMINVELGNFLLENKASLQEIVLRCADYKNEITSGDFKEKGLRQVLNFGHTIGHAIEKIYGISHGESVFWGMYLILSIYGEKDDIQRLISLSHKVGSGLKLLLGEIKLSLLVIL